MQTNKISPDTKRMGGILLIISFIIVLILLGFLFHISLYHTKKPNFYTTQANTKITLYRDQDYHFRIPGTINGVQVIFLIDTGATNIAIPGHIARRAHLKFEHAIQANTANGIADGYITRIQQCTIGPIVFENIKAMVIPAMQQDEVLLGMNALKQLNFQQTAETLIIMTR